MDNAATTYPKPKAVADAIYHQILYMPGNAGRGTHPAALSAGNLLQETREALAKLFNISQSERIAFTMNITQALNVALLGYLKPGDHVISTDMEHNALARPLELLRKTGVQWSRISAGHGFDLDQLRRTIRPNTRMVCMLHASNVTGDIFPITEIGAICQEYDVRFLVDTAQSAGFVDIDVQRDHIDLLAFTGHKGLLGPQGVGGLYLRPGLILQPVITGGTGSFSESLEQPWFMPDLLESGTMNLPGIAGLKAALEFLRQTGKENLLQQERKHFQQLWEGLKEIPGVVLYGSGNVEQMTPVISFTIGQTNSLEIADYLEEKSHIFCRAGLHCAGLAHTAIGTFQTGTCRLSPGYFTRSEEIERVIQTVEQAAQKFK